MLPYGNPLLKEKGVIINFITQQGDEIMSKLQTAAIAADIFCWCALAFYAYHYYTCTAV